MAERQQEPAFGRELLHAMVEVVDDVHVVAYEERPLSRREIFAHFIPVKGRKGDKAYALGGGAASSLSVKMWVGFGVVTARRNVVSSPTEVMKCRIPLGTNTMSPSWT